MSDAAPAPGWYPADGQLRWWDGTSWTEHTREIPDADPVTAPGTAATPAASFEDIKVEPGTIWHATGKPLTGVGAGRYRLTDRYLYFEKGALRTKAQQIPIHELYDVDANQSIAQKARGVGTITLHVRRATGIEIVHLEDVPNFREGVQAINDTSRAAREYLENRSRTQTFNHQGGGYSPGMSNGYAPAGFGGHAAGAPGGHAMPASVPTPASSGDDILAQLERLGGLRDAGVLTPDEFEAKKAEMLRRL